MVQIIDKLSTVHENKPSTVTTALLYKKKIYLSQRIGSIRFNERWQGAGGKLNDGEHPLIGAQREVFEETGLYIDTNRFVHISEILDHPSTKCCTIYYVQLNDNEIPENREAKTKYFPQASDWHLFSFENAEELFLMPSLMKVLDILKNL